MRGIKSSLYIIHKSHGEAAADKRVDWQVILCIEGKCLFLIHNADKARKIYGSQAGI